MSICTVYTHHIPQKCYVNLYDIVWPISSAILIDLWSCPHSFKRLLGFRAPFAGTFKVVVAREAASLGSAWPRGSGPFFLFLFLGRWWWSKCQRVDLGEYLQETIDYIWEFPANFSLNQPIEKLDPWIQTGLLWSPRSPAEVRVPSWRPRRTSFLRGERWRQQLPQGGAPPLTNGL